MEYLKLPKDYFSFNEDERVELANRVVFDKDVCMKILIDDNGVDYITSILNGRLSVYINEEEYEQADFMDKIIKTIINNYEQRM